MFSDIMREVRYLLHITLISLHLSPSKCGKEFNWIQLLKKPAQEVDAGIFPKSPDSAARSL